MQGLTLQSNHGSVIVGERRSQEVLTCAPFSSKDLPMQRACVRAFLCFVIAAAPHMARAEDIVTTPLQYYGLGSLMCADLSGDGRNVATGGGAGGFIWDAETGTVTRMLSGHLSGVGCIAFSQDGTKVITGSAGGKAKLWRVLDSTEICSLYGHDSAVRDVALSPTGEMAVTGSADWTAKLWDAATGAQLRELSGHTGAVMAVAFSPEVTTVLTGSSDNTAMLWSVSDGALIRTFSGHTDGVRSVAFSPDGTVALTASEDRTAKMWDLSSGALIGTFTGHSDAVLTAVFSPDAGRVLTGSENGSVKLWDVAGHVEIRSFPNHADAVVAARFSPDGSCIFTASLDNTAVIRATANGAEIQRFDRHTPRVYSVAISPDGKWVLTGDADYEAKLWKASDGTFVRSYVGHAAAVRSVAFSPDGEKVLTASNDGRATLWDRADGTEILTFSGHGHYVLDAHFSPDGAHVLTGSQDRTAKIWKVSDGSVIHTLSGHASEVYSVAYSPDGSIVATCGSDHTAKTWDATTGELIRTFTGHAYNVHDVAFSPIADELLTGSTTYTPDFLEEAKLWDLTTGQEIRSISRYPGAVYSVAYSPNGRRFLTGGQTSDWPVVGMARLWNPENGNLIRSFQGHTDRVYSVVWSSDGMTALTGSRDGTARLWQATNKGDKVILVAGGGDYVGNAIASQTQALADRAFFTMLVRGYRPEDIMYLSAFDDWDTRDSNNDNIPDADAYASVESLWSAVDSWSSDTARLILYLIDHGTFNSSTGQYFFSVNPTESIRALDLDAHLDVLQNSTGNDLILIVDCCFSGGFVQQCTPLPGMRRVAISATTADALSVYSPPAGAESFSFYFLSFALLGNTLDNCYRWTKLSFATMRNPAGQDPWMDDNGDGRADNMDGDLAAQHVLGRFPAFGLRAPTILTVSPPRRVTAGHAADLWARLEPSVDARAVWAVIVPPQQQYADGEPVTDLTRVDLVRDMTPGLWRGSWTPTTDDMGVCSVTFFAESNDSLNTHSVATPVATSFRVTGTAVELPWVRMR